MNLRQRLNRLEQERGSGNLHFLFGLVEDGETKEAAAERIISDSTLDRSMVGRIQLFDENTVSGFISVECNEYEDVDNLVGFKEWRTALIDNLKPTVGPPCERLT